MASGWDKENARHSMAKKFGKAPPYRNTPPCPKKYEKSVPAEVASLKSIYPTACNFINDLYKDEAVKTTINQVKIKIYPRDARPECFGIPPTIDAESFPEEKIIRIYSSDNKWAKLNKNSLYQNTVIVHELIHIIEKHHAEKKKGYANATLKEWEKYPEEKIAMNAERLFEKKYGEKK